MKLEDLKIIVTGAASGMGAHFAKQLHAAGAKVAAWLWNDRREYVLSQAISALLLEEAIAVGDAAAIDHESRHNRLAVPTRSR